MAFFDQAQATYSQQHGLAPDDADFLQQTALAQAGPSKAPLNPVTITWYQCDHLGTPQELTAANGDIVWQASYKTWGNTATVEWVAADGAAQARQLADPATFEHAQVQPLRFQGQYFDAETGLHYNRFRYYDPDVGRFVSNDPIGLAGGDNLYLYAPNSITWTDPMGLKRTPHVSTTCDGAAKSALASANPKSIRKNKEYGGLIYSKGGKFYATTPVAGTGRTFKPILAMPQVPSGAKIVGDYHTHGDYSVQGKNGSVIRTSDPARDDFSSDQFSKSDERVTALARAKNPCHRSYLGTPSGEIKVN